MGNDASLRPFVLDDAIRRIRRFTSIQIQGMAQLASDQARHACLHAIAACAMRWTDALAEMVLAGRTRPPWRLRLAETHPPARESPDTLQIGVYALAANPLHWGHILVGLTALVLMKLDRVIFVIAGEDPRKPFMLQQEIRHRLARTVIDAFEPFFEYSPIALGSGLDGETNLGRLLALNPRQRVHAFYVAGSDHYRRRNQRGEPDTIEKLEGLSRSLLETSASGHTVSAVFIDRLGQGDGPVRVETFLDVHTLPAVPLMCSSTAARHDLCAGELTEAVTSVPYATFAEIQSLGLYGTKLACQEGLSA